MSWKVKWEDILTTNKRGKGGKRLGSMLSINRYSLAVRSRATNALKGQVPFIPTVPNPSFTLQSSASAETINFPDMNRQVFVRTGYYKVNNGADVTLVKSLSAGFVFCLGRAVTYVRLDALCRPFSSPTLQGSVIAIKPINKARIDVNRALMLEMKRVSSKP